MYWVQILSVYASLPDDLPPRERWGQAYQAMQQELGTYREPGTPPSFDSPVASLPQEFAEQYAAAVDYMMAAHSTRLQLPTHFMERWNKAIKLFGKEG